MTRAARLGRHLAAGIAGALLCVAAAPCWSSTTLTCTSVTAAPALGNVVSAPAGSGNTTFTVTASSGAIAVTAGSGKRLTAGSSLVTATVTCTSSGTTNCAPGYFKIANIGTPTKRAIALTKFTVASGTGTVTSVSGTNPLTFQITSIPYNTSKTFLVGMDFGIADDTGTGPATGAASSGFEVLAGLTSPPTVGCTTAAATATVFRPIGLSFLPAGGLVFGKIIKPALATGNGTVTINDSTGARTFTGTAAGDPNPSPSNVTYTVTGEGGQAFTITVPATVAMTSGTNSLTVTLTSTFTGAQNLSNAVGSAGTFAFKVGGSFPVTNTTASGVYSGTFAVTVSYN